MATLDDIYDEVAGIIQDPAWDSDKVIQLFNDGIRAISEVLLLPELETIGTVTTSTTLNYVALPTNYQRKIRDCRNPTNPFRRIRIYGSVPLMHAHFTRTDLVGHVVGVAVMGRNLYYQWRPSSTTSLQINYFAKPAVLQENEEPSVLPAFANELLLNYACWKVYGVIEEGMDGVKTQTQFYQGQFMSYVGQLKDFIGPEQNKPIHIKDELSQCWRIWG